MTTAREELGRNSGVWAEDRSWGLTGTGVQHGFSCRSSSQGIRSQDGIGLALIRMVQVNMLRSCSHVLLSGPHPKEVLEPLSGSVHLFVCLFVLLLFSRQGLEKPDYL